MAFLEELIAGVRVPRWVPDGPDAPRNFGDEIGPLLVGALVGSGAREGDARLISVGSVLQYSLPGDVIWGTGINGNVRQRVRYPLDVRSVRGPLTRAILLGHGVRVPKVYGDPALLVPRLFPSVAPEGSGSMLVVPNLNELDRVSGSEVLSPLGDPLAIAGRIAGSGFVVASSLHALVLADAYGIPSRPLVPEAEHPLKYLDYYAGTGRPGVAFARSVDEAIELGPVAAAEADIDAIAQAFPRDLWGGSATSPDNSSADYSELRRESWRAREALALAVGREASDSAAQALLRVDQLVAQQPDDLVRVLELCSTSAVPDGAALNAAVRAHLDGSEPHGETDARLSRAVRRVAGKADLSVIARVAATGKVSLARLIARGEKIEDDGRAHLGDEEAVAPPKASRLPRVLRRRG
ncbi:MAG: polysaccharide pyruvyl transferase family protein [Microbacterium gubbeenense]|uniref:polysaccharide pyruvyl transferase family protein n=4 Tax=Microbacterium gubbeenense TaxID=159896 RepID=UPI0003FE9FAC|nr:polysaccharide pyruvyl transferase family protein [Microbacterium gubbeenense]